MPRSFFLTPRKSDVLHKASVRVLEQTGVKIGHEESIDLYLSAGAKKDDDGRVLIPARLVDEALEKIRCLHKNDTECMRLYDRDGENPIKIEMGRTYFGPGSDAMYNIDLDTGKRRQSVLSDVSTNVTIADKLPGFDFIMSMALPSDVPPERLYAAVFAEMVKHTTKPIVTTCTGLVDLSQVHEIAKITAGGAETLRKKPFFIAYLEPVSPLIMDDTSCERLLCCAENRVPMLYAAGANCGSGAPVTPEGGVVQGGAESLAGLVLATLKSDDVQFVYGANTSAMDMKSTIVCYGDPVWFRTVAMYADLGRYYKLPTWGTAGSSDAFTIDAQAAMEAYEGISLAVMAGTTLAHDVGYLAHGELYDARMLVMTDMMIGRAKQILKPVDLSEDALAVDVIDEVARSGGLYLTHPHTSKSFRKSLWLPPKYINRKHLDLDKEHDMADLMGDEVKNILAKHTPRALPEETVKAIDDYVAGL